jgi:hypothetical protein
MRSHAALAHLALAFCAGVLLVTVAQPLRTDDLWWHLALGREFAQHGAWLAEDPLLFAPAGPPSPASWLADVGLAGVAQTAGFHGLRALHVASAAAILALAWLQLRRASRSAVIASAGTIAFAALAAYRLLQLRPDLVSIAMTLLCYGALIADERPPSARRIAAVALLFALWANGHAGFPLGLLVIGAAIAGLVLAAPLRSPLERSSDRARALRLGAALGAAALATLANPLGFRAHLVYLAAGSSTPSLDRIVDDWAPVDLFALPASSRASPLAWTLAWILVVGVVWLSTQGLRSARVRRRLDPAKLGIAIVSIAVLLSAVRFLWLGILPLLLFAALTGRRRARQIAAVACLLAVAFAKVGEERLATRDAVFDPLYYQRPFSASKYHAHAIWILADAGLSGNLYTDYFLGGFAGYWLAPQLRTLVNGSLNVPSESLDALGAIAQHRGLRPDEPFTALLDRLGIDLFLGIRLPETRPTAAVGIATTAHLENTEGWIPVFRNLTSAIYLRVNDRNRANLDRIANYYAEQRVPFDRGHGFAVDAVIRDAPEWAVAHGIAPRDFVPVARRVAAGRAPALARNRIAAISAVLGRYERAIALDQVLVREEPRAVGVQRRRVWSLLRLGRFEDAAAAAVDLAARPANDQLSAWIADTARTIDRLDAEASRAATAVLPFLTPGESAQLQQSIEAPPPRPAR